MVSLPSRSITMDSSEASRRMAITSIPTTVSVSGISIVAHRSVANPILSLLVVSGVPTGLSITVVSIDGIAITDDLTRFTSETLSRPSV